MRHPLRALTLLALLTFAACGSPVPATPTPTAATSGGANVVASPVIPQPSTPTPSGTPATTTRPAPSPSPSPSPSPPQCSYRMTGYMTNQSLTAQFQAALVAANLPNATGMVSEAGENLVCSDGTSKFLLMSNRMSVTLPVADLADRTALGVLLAQILTVAMNHGVAPNKDFSVAFTMGGATEYVMTHPNAWEQARRQGLTGAALLDALQGKSR